MYKPEHSFIIYLFLTPSVYDQIFQHNQFVLTELPMPDAMLWFMNQF